MNPFTLVAQATHRDYVSQTRAGAPSSAPMKDFGMSEAMENLARDLEATGDYRILRRLRPRETLDAGADSDAKHIGVILDLETTGLDTATCEVIEIGLLKFAYCDDGRISNVVETYSSFNEPSVPLPAEVIELTGITEDQVRGQCIDPVQVASFVADADIVVAHNARYDRKICERYWEIFRTKAWACSATQVEWRKHKFEGAKLDALLRGIGLFHDGHRALTDCYAVLEILSRPTQHVAQSAFALMLQQAQRRMIRVWAEQASYSVKDSLKARGYKWNNGANGRPKSWYCDVEEHVCAEEVAYLEREVYRRKVDVRLQPIDAQSRFSVRD